MFIITNKAAAGFQAVKSDDIRRLVVSRQEDACTVEADFVLGDRVEPVILAIYPTHERAADVALELATKLADAWEADKPGALYQMPEV